MFLPINQERILSQLLYLIHARNFKISFSSHACLKGDEGCNTLSLIPTIYITTVKATKNAVWNVDLEDNKYSKTLVFETSCSTYNVNTT
jgi:hypothetical protein